MDSVIVKCSDSGASGKFLSLPRTGCVILEDSFGGLLPQFPHLVKFIYHVILLHD